MKMKSKKSVMGGYHNSPLKAYFPIFILPTLAAFFIGFIYPFLRGIYLSFCTFRTTSDAEWVGLSNYMRAFEDNGFFHAFWYTALFTVVSVVIVNLLAFAVAYVFTRGIRGTNIFRTVFFMPNLIGGIVLGYIWQMIFDGILRNYGTSIVLDIRFGFWGLVILMAWQQIGYMMIIYIAGLQSVPEELNEAAKIDGANGWQSLRHITIPTVMPSITICTFLTLTNSFKLFDQNLALTGGAPISFTAEGQIRETEMLALNIYNTFYSNATWRGVGQAKAVIFFVLVAVIALLQLKLTRDKEEQR